jgi:hypothetical protein
VAPPDREHPDVLMLVGTNAAQSTLPARTGLDQATWHGEANPLSPAHVDWPIIEDVLAATRKPATVPQLFTPLELAPLARSSSIAAARLIRQRRSCLALDGTTVVSAEAFFAILDHLLPRPAVPPWDALPWSPAIHVGLFVHRVAGLAPGLYILERDAAVHDGLRAALQPQFAWEPVASCPAHLRLFLLAKGDFREKARIVSCHQDIAADGAFSLGMIADFGDAIRERGAWWYRRLFWEAGVLGQVLYLEAEAAGVRGTGIGCYFDDLFHDLLGLRGDRFQDLYHFTVGGPVEDRRLTSLPAYAHLQR